MINVINTKIFNTTEKLKAAIYKTAAEYIFFKAEKDIISVDCIRLMEKAVLEKEADILFADLLNINAKGERYYYNLEPSRYKETFTGKQSPYELYNAFHTRSNLWKDLRGKAIKKNVLLQAFAEADYIEAIYKKSNIISRVENAFFFYCEDNNDDKGGYFRSIKTSVSEEFDYYETMKKDIMSELTNIVSFDVFDTLVSRRAMEPIDVFSRLEKKFNERIHSSNPVLFAEIRKAAEKSARDRLHENYPENEDITLDDIYDEISFITGFPMELIDAMKQEEINLEKELCFARPVGQELYQLAIDSGKRIVCISDMYLPKDVILDILEDCGYKHVEKVFVSSDIKKCKWSGKLFDYVLSSLNIRMPENNCFIHIGDNYHADIEGANVVGVKSYYLPSGITRFWEGVARRLYSANGSIVDSVSANALFSGIRTMNSLVINNLYSNPYLNWSCAADFNANPYLIGYHALGMHLLAVVDWLYKDAKKKGYNRIHFLSRDGYLPIEAYKIWTADDNRAPEAVYTYMSRNVIPLCDISSKEDIFNIAGKIDLPPATPKKIISIFKKAIPEEKLLDIETFTLTRGFEYNKAFGDFASGYRFLKVLAEDLVDLELLHEANAETKEYLESIFKEQECLFDMGYNGRVETALEASLGFPVDSYYIHDYKEVAHIREQSNSFHINTFYDFQPVVSFLVREQIFSKVDKLFKGVKKNPDGSFTRIFEEEDVSFETKWVTEMLQAGAIAFISDMKSAITSYAKDIYFRTLDASIPFEFYLHRSKPLDRAIFSCVEFEDKFGGSKTFDLEKWWQKDINERVGASISPIDVAARVALEDVNWRLSETRKSLSYRIGLAVTSIPRNIRKLIKGGDNYGKQ